MSNELARPQPATPTVVTDIDIPFGRLVMIILKWMLASIPAMLVFYAIFFGIALVIMTLFGGVAALIGSGMPDQP